MARRAITVLETMVVVSIVAIFLGLIVPAVQIVREAANGMRCRNNLKQLALACHGHEQQRGRFPSGGSWCGSADGWGLRVAPYCELPPDGQVRTPALFACPSRPAPTGLRGDYAASGGAEYGAPCLPGWPVAFSDRRTGAFRWSGRGPGLAVGDFADGVSTTLLLGEKRYNAAQPLEGQPTSNEAWWCGWDWDAAAWTVSPPAPDWRDQSPGWWAGGVWRLEGARFGSAHPGGLNAAFADGAVKFVRYGVTPAAWRALGTAAGGD